MIFRDPAMLKNRFSEQKLKCSNIKINKTTTKKTRSRRTGELCLSHKFMPHSIAPSWDSFNFFVSLFLLLDKWRFTQHDSMRYYTTWTDHFGPLRLEKCGKESQNPQNFSGLWAQQVNTKGLFEVEMRFSIYFYILLHQQVHSHNLHKVKLSSPRGWQVEHRYQRRDG